jgi:hypothetical protein
MRSCPPLAEVVADRQLEVGKPRRLSFSSPGNLFNKVSENMKMHDMLPTCGYFAQGSLTTSASGGALCILTPK